MKMHGYLLYRVAQKPTFSLAVLLWVVRIPFSISLSLACCSKIATSKYFMAINITTMACRRGSRYVQQVAAHITVVRGRRLAVVTTRESIDEVTVKNTHHTAKRAAGSRDEHM